MQNYDAEQINSFIFIRYVGSKCPQSHEAIDGNSPESHQEEERCKLPAVSQQPPYDPDLDGDVPVPPPEEPESDLREVPVQIRREYRDPTHLWQD